MSKPKKTEETRAAAEAPTAPTPGSAPGEPRPAGPACPSGGTPAESAAGATRASRGRMRRWLPDLAKVALALAVIAVAAAIWYQPPLILADFPYVSYAFQGQRATDAQLFRPLAMPTRYYIALPRQLAGRSQWFAVDRRREVAALTEQPSHRFLGRPAIKRSDPLGLDLEFRKLDGSEWRIFFFEDSIVFSNALLTVRMDTRQDASP